MDSEDSHGQSRGTVLPHQRVESGLGLSVALVKFHKEDKVFLDNRVSRMSKIR